jgi:hypothetical protein
MERALAALALVAPVLAPLPAAAQGIGWNRERYAKQEVLIPMRDGTRLFTAIYTPRDRSRSYPVLMERTPYGVAPYGREAYKDTLGPSDEFGREGFIFVYQDVRGRMMSEGTFVDLTPEREGGVDGATDTWDTVEWILRHVAGNNGRVGQWGISYPAFYAAAAMSAAHPAMKAVSPQAPIADWFAGDDFHRNGALWLPHLFNFIAAFGRPRPAPTTRCPPSFHHGTEDGYRFFLELGPLTGVNGKYFKGAIPFWNDVMEHGTDDAYWKARDLRPRIRNVHPAVMMVGGWFDAENLFGTLQVHQALERQSPGTDHCLVMGPWSHGGWSHMAGDRLGDVAFGSATSIYFQTQLEFPFFMHHLKGAPDPALARATVFQTGANRWRKFDAWPPATTRPASLWFQAGARLGFQKADQDGAAPYASDPAHPVPFFDGQTPGMPPEYMIADQRFAEGRPDVVTFRSEPLDRDLAVAGPLRADLWVTTTGTDSDWVVKVIDAFPEAPRAGLDPALAGYEQLVRGEVMRGKFRHSLEQPEPFVPGRPTEVAFGLNDICHTFQRGHRIVVQIQSSWFPLMDRNPQVFTDIYHARPGDFRKAEQRVLFGPSFPSRIELPVLP